VDGLHRGTCAKEGRGFLLDKDEDAGGFTFDWIVPSTERELSFATGLAKVTSTPTLLCLRRDLRVYWRRLLRARHRWNLRCDEHGK
jgi:hypothetical protein